MHENVTLQSGLVKTEDGFAFRDLNKNGKLDVYEDPRQPLEARVEDLLAQMTLEEKAGMMFINGATINDDGSIEDKPGAQGFGRSAVKQVLEHRMNHFNLWQIPGAQVVAAWHNQTAAVCRGVPAWHSDDDCLGSAQPLHSQCLFHGSNRFFSMV